MLKPKTWLRVGLLVAGAVALALFLSRFPWSTMPAVIGRAHPGLLAVALAVNLVSFIAKGSAWYFLLRAGGPCRWLAAQEANLLGAATNSVSISVAGETARVRDLATREAIPAGRVAASVVRTRAVEALALACFMLLAPAILELPPLLHGLQATGGGLMLTLVAVAWSGRRVRLLELLPVKVRSVLTQITETGSVRTFIPALLFAILNWVALWASYQLTLSAFGIQAPLAASFTALIMTNLGGLFRLSPGNVGVTQAAMIVSLLPFGVPAPQSLAAGVALQAIQILPVLALALLLMGWRQIAARARPRAA
ncbi:MAG TPA: lysylphosphatidylglycerol synthase transmembrane domain-containing protein [Candidatus Binatia bacterium]|nr:lysylphosphatidylglycerol synthase transmembrane domain-containing protein [Candidatus Binatia bacterium]